MINDAIDILKMAIKLYDPIAIFSLYSGGKDSTGSNFVATQTIPGVPAVHINTGIGIEETRQHVRRQCSVTFNCPLYEYCASTNKDAEGNDDPQHYDDLVRSHGFPGSTEVGHRKMYIRLKERPLRQMVRENAAHVVRRYKTGPNKGKQYRRLAGNILLISGCRSAESTRRMGNTKMFAKHGRWVWVNPLIDFSTSDVFALAHQYGLPPNPVSDLCCHSWECGCGAFASEQQYHELGHHFPYFKRHIDRLTDEIWDRFPWHWWESPPQWFLQQQRGQDLMFDLSREKPLQNPTPMCTSCVAAHEIADGQSP